jgi:hypothetical protein
VALDEWPDCALGLPLVVRIEQPVLRKPFRRASELRYLLPDRSHLVANVDEAWIDGTRPEDASSRRTRVAECRERSFDRDLRAWAVGIRAALRAFGLGNRRDRLRRRVVGHPALALVEAQHGGIALEHGPPLRSGRAIRRGERDTADRRTLLGNL